MTANIIYVVSLGKYTLNASDFNGKTVAQANEIIEAANNKGAGVKLVVNKDASSQVSNTLNSCEVSGKTVTCTKPNGAVIPDSQLIWNGSTSVNGTVSRVNEVLGVFNNVNIEYTDNIDMSEGYIIEIRVNGNSQYTPNSMYDVDSTTITVVIDDK